MQSVRNYWSDAKCAKAFWGQHDLPPYKTLLADTVAWADPKPGQRWLDLGCGGGAITRAIWERTAGQVEEIVGLDCAAANEESYRHLRETLSPRPENRVRFACHNFSSGLGLFPAEAFDHAVSGLSISYAESMDATTGLWTTQAYDDVLRGVYRVIRPGGRFVFSVNVPEPSWGKVGLLSLSAIVRSRRPLQFLKKSWRMMIYGAWLKREARTGRFHYLPAPRVEAMLESAGFANVRHRLSYAKQAYIFQAEKLK